ncbi:SO_0444 family Cu/Zn efflux transporter [Bradyrhizobium sp.]|uniref:SO_0444 family Cu/Zn efflux transporter n=1 Tax=Bradyrhizobium sp. TaxID=376 RepID=UPI002C3E2C96|nr:SO_0444 family Cu/Zn efflux transporter [Bradyrhizobium sp.]HWX59465.1 SO_0444 family Cu/Zn efflux transporter [Bradyrhizobium sp.]
MIDFLLAVLQAFWAIMKEASVYLLVGFLMAGVLAVLVPRRLLTRLVGTGKLKSVLWGSVLGAPLPLCSCGVLPTAVGLRREGATPGATVAFLVATPETGVDSISLTYALTDPLMTVFRPIAGVLTAIVAGVLTNLFGVTERPAGVAVGNAHTGDVDHGHAHGYPHDGLGDAHDHDHDHADVPRAPTAGGPRLAIVGTVSRIVRYGFRDLLDDVAWWLVLGLVLSAIIEVALPAKLFEIWGGGVASMLLMLVLSILLYTCGVCSTPMAAALALKGLSPGAALVFLVAGPATNIGSVVVLLKILGMRAVGVYLAAVAIMTLAAGFALNGLYQAWGIDPRLTFGSAAEFVPESVKITGAVLLSAVLIVSMWRTRVPEEWVWLRDRFAGTTGLRVTGRGLAWGAAIVAMLLWLGSGIFIVGPGEIGMKLRFGRVVASDLPPGLHFRLARPLESHLVVAQTLVQRFEVGASEASSRAETTRAQLQGRPAFGSNAAPEGAAAKVWFAKETTLGDPSLLTGDGNLIDLRYAVPYRVKSALDYAYNIAEPEALVRSTVLAALRGVVAAHPIDAVYTTARDEIERAARDAAQTMLDRYRAGIEILAVRLLYVHPPDAVHEAFRDVASAQEDKLRTINLAYVFAVEKVNQAKGEAAAMTEAAAAFKDQRIAAAAADAEAFALRLEAYRRAPELTKFRLQIETLEDVLPGTRKFVRPGAGDVKDIDMWLLRPPLKEAQDD